MVIELAIVLLIILVGSSILMAFGFSGWPTLPLGYLVGLAVSVCAILVQAVLRAPTTIVFPLGLTVAVAVTIWLHHRRSGRSAEVDVVAILAASILVTMLVVLAWEANLVTYHYDSVQYVTAGSLIGQGNIGSMDPTLFRKRLSSISLLNSYSILNGSFYLRSLVPLTALSTLAAVYWTLDTGLRQLVGRRLGAAAGILGVGLLLSSYGFLWQSFYVNGHLLFGAFFLLATGASWLLAIKVSVPKPVLATVAVAGIVGALLSRSEAGLLVILVLLPVLLTQEIDVRVRQLLGATAGVTLLLEQTLQADMLRRVGRDLPQPVVGMLGLGLLLVVAVTMLNARWIRRFSRRLVWISEGFLWATLGAFALRDPTVLRDSLEALWANLVAGRGLWGLSLVTLGLLVTWALARPPFLGRPLLRFPVTAFVPMALLLAYLRGTAFRVGPFDSMNRMVLQVVPAAVVFIMVALAVDGDREVVAHRRTNEEEPFQHQTDGMQTARARPPTD